MLVRGCAQHVAWVEHSDTQGAHSRVSLRSTRATIGVTLVCKGLQLWGEYNPPQGKGTAGCTRRRASRPKPHSPAINRSMVERNSGCSGT
jgi:hypothetical protein